MYPGPDPVTAMANCLLLVHLMTRAPCQACIITTDSHVNSCTNGLKAERATFVTYECDNRTYGRDEHVS